MLSRIAVIFVAAVLVAAPALAQVTAKPLSAAPPDNLQPAIKKLIGDVGVTIAAAGAALEFWWVTTLPLAAAGAAEWSNVPEGALIGALRVTGPFREIRGKTIKPGTYTLRLGLQPQNGDHLGNSPFREFLLLSPAAVDGDPAPQGFDGTVALSKQTIGTAHPAALSIDPPAATSAPLSTLKSDLGHDGVVVEVKTSGGPLRFGVIVIGRIEH